MDDIIPLKEIPGIPKTDAYRLAMDQTAMVAITDRSGKIIFVNENFCSVSKYSREEVLGKGQDLFNTGFHPEEFFESMWNTVQQGEVWTGQIRNRAKDGGHFWTMTTMVPLLDGLGQPYQYLSFHLDITEQKQAEERLDENMERLCILANNFPNGSVSLIDTSLNFVLSGGTGFHEANINPQELVGRPIKSVLSQTTYSFIEEQLPKILNGETINHEVFVRNRYFQITYKPVFDASGNPYGFVMVVQDITAKKKADLEIQRNNDLFAIGEEIAGIGSWDVHFSQRTINFSSNTLRLLGQNTLASSISVREIIQLVHPEDRELLKAYIRNMFVESNPELKVFRVTIPDGTVRFFQSSCKTYRNENNDLMRITGVIKDISERIRNERELLDSKEMLRNIADSIPGLVMRYVEKADGSSEILYLSKGAELMWEIPHKEFMGNENLVWKKVHPDDFEEAIGSFRYAGASITVWSREYRILMDDGRVKWVSVIGNPKKLKDGSVMWNILALDVTDRKVAEETIENNMNLLTLQNTQLMDFCNIVSHNLRSPLVNMSMLIEFIEESEDENERMVYIEKLKPVIDNLNETFEELVESIQVKQDHELISEEIDVLSYFNKVISGFEGQIVKSDALITTDFEKAPLLFYPPKYFSSILHNLISNALKYRSPDRKSEISITTTRIKDTVLLSVKDNGLGIDTVKHKDNLFKIRKVFHRHPDAKGFGLFITKTQVEARGGEIWVESEPGQGSTFFIKFKKQRIDPNKEPSSG